MTTVKSACVEPTTGIALQFDHWGYRHASRKHFAVRGLDLKIHAGEHVLLLGASGIGKSTILEGAAGLLGDETGQTDASRVNNAAEGEPPVAVEDADGGITEGAIASVHSPIGTAIKAVTPEEIAVSITGEMICVRATRREAAGEVPHGCPMY